LETEERLILHGKTVPPHLAIPHRNNLKHCASWLGKIQRLVVKTPALHLIVQITVHYFKLFKKPMKKLTNKPYLIID